MTFADHEDNVDSAECGSFYCNCYIFLMWNVHEASDIFAVAAAAVVCYCTASK